ncbi:MAG: hypothetical protein WKF82_02855 [Nocardioidaceae bacterium]
MSSTTAPAASSTTAIVTAQIGRTTYRRYAVGGLLVGAVILSALGVDAGWLGSGGAVSTTAMMGAGVVAVGRHGPFERNKLTTVVDGALAQAADAGRLLTPEQAFVRYGLVLVDPQRLLVLDRHDDDHGAALRGVGVPDLRGGLIASVLRHGEVEVVVMYADLLDSLSPALLNQACWARRRGCGAWPDHRGHEGAAQSDHRGPGLTAGRQQAAMTSSKRALDSED